MEGMKIGEEMRREDSGKNWGEWTDLHVTFCDIKGSDTSVGEATGEDTTKHALGVVAGVVGDGTEIT